MVKCAYCDRDIEGLPFKCHYCGQYFCAEHHLPENHECPGLSRRRPSLEPNEGLRCAYCGKLLTEVPFRCKYCGKYFCTEHHLPEKHNCPALSYIRRPRLPMFPEAQHEEETPPSYTVPVRIGIEHRRYKQPNQGFLKRVVILALISFVIFITVTNPYTVRILDNVIHGVNSLTTNIAFKTAYPRLEIKKYPLTSSSTVTYKVFNYRTGKLYTISVTIQPNEAYDFTWKIYHYPGEQVDMGKYEAEVYNKIIGEALETQAIRMIIEKLKHYSNGDPELYCNLAMQITKQMSYDSEKGFGILFNIDTDWRARNPLKVLIDRRCICFEASLLYVTLLAGAGLDVYLIEANVTGSTISGAHMMVAVKLPKLSDLRLHMTHQYEGKVTYYANIMINGETYYLADPTPYSFPISPTSVLEYFGTFVGEHTWDSINVDEIIPIRVS